MLEIITQWLSSQLPEGFHPFDTLPTLGFVIVIVFVLAALIRAIADKASKYTHALASAMALLFMYIFLMMAYTENAPGFITEALKSLPLIDLHDGVVTLYQFEIRQFPLFFNELLRAFILSLTLIILDELIPDSKNGLAWIVLQMFITVVSVFLYWGVINAIEAFMPGVLDSHAPLILGCILLFMVFLGVLKLILGLLLAAVNPLLGAVSAFFGTSTVGKAVGKAALCALLLCVVNFFMVNAGYVSFVLVNMTWLVCILPLIVILLLWFVVGYIL